jgi:hypothetical protein
MRLAGQIPGIQMMFSPEWPAIFYLPRQVPSEAIDADSATLKAKTEGLRDIGVALDWNNLSPLVNLGFRCEQWSHGTPVALSAELAVASAARTKNGDPVPRAYHCAR